MRHERPRPPTWTYLIPLPDGDNEWLSGTPEKALSCAQALQRIAYLARVGMNATEGDLVDVDDEAVLNHLSLYAWAWTRRAAKLLEEPASARRRPQETTSGPE